MGTVHLVFTDADGESGVLDENLSMNYDGAGKDQIVTQVSVIESEYQEQHEEVDARELFQWLVAELPKETAIVEIKIVG